MMRNVFLQRAALHESHEVMPGHVLQQHLRLRRQRMAARHDQRQRIVPEYARAQAMQVGRVRQHPDVARARPQRVGDLVAEALFQVDGNMRVVLEERAEHGRQVFAERRGVAQHANVPLQASPVVVEFATHAVDLAKHQPGMMDQRAPGGCDLHAARLAHQQRHAQRVLHAADALAGRGQRHVRTPRPRRDGAGFVHIQK